MGDGVTISSSSVTIGALERFNDRTDDNDIDGDDVTPAD